MSHLNRSYCTNTGVKQRQPWPVNRWMSACEYKCCKFGCLDGIMDNASELESVAPSFNFSRVSYCNVRTNILGKVMNRTLLTQPRY